ncbi:MAG: hypothetical protein IIA59_11280 [Candidatus Marinimicrobia bacterium]|nr:hypothetical protein [Candidatus Neomarinimicrobiota bacterium]
MGIIGVGLLQIWVLLMVLQANGHPAHIEEILGGGGLFFFATSIVVGSALSLFDYSPPKIGSLDFNMSAICCGVVLLVTVVYYTEVLSGGGVAEPNPFSKHVVQQLFCTSVALWYWYYSGRRTGLFVKKDYDPR